MSRRTAWAVTQVAVTALVVFFIGRFVAVNWAALSLSGDALKLRPAKLALAAGIVLTTYAMLIAAWRAVLLGWGERLRYAAAARIWCLSNLARYVPGRVWQIAGMAALAQRAGISPWAAAGSAIVVQLLAVASGALVTVGFAPNFGHPLLIGLAGALTGGAALALTLQGPAGTLARALSTVSGRNIELRPVAAGPLFLSAVITAVAWAAYGLALVFSVDGLVGGRGLDPREAIGVFTGSYVAGLVNVFTPGGLGTREVILVSFLVGPLGPAAASVVAIGSRLLMTMTELVAALITIPLTSES